MNRRGFIAGLAALAAPAVIRTPGLLMPVRPPLMLAPMSERARAALFDRAMNGLVELNEASMNATLLHVARILERKYAAAERWAADDRVTMETTA